jgi:hypothetical protein
MASFVKLFGHITIVPAECRDMKATAVCKYCDTLVVAWNLSECSSNILLKYRRSVSNSTRNEEIYFWTDFPFQLRWLSLPAHAFSLHKPHCTSTSQFPASNALEVGTFLSLHCFLVYLFNVCDSNRKQLSAELQIFFINSQQTLRFIIMDL